VVDFLITLKERKIALIGAPFDAGASQVGCRAGPVALRAAGIEFALRQLGYQIRDLGDIKPGRVTSPKLDGHARHVSEVSSWVRALSATTFQVAKAGFLPLLLGGDHSLSMGTANGAARHAKFEGRELFVLWFDAHTDYNTPSTTPSGNMHGMPLAFLCGEVGFDTILGNEPQVRINPGQVYLLGVRSVDREERNLISESGVKIVNMRQLSEVGISEVIRGLLEEVDAANGMLHVSLDADFLDPDLAPGVGTAVLGGASVQQAHLAMSLLFTSGLVTSLDIVELNPLLDERSRSAKLLVDLIASLFGRNHDGKTTNDILESARY